MMRTMLLANTPTAEGHAEVMIIMASSPEFPGTEDEPSSLRGAVI